MILILIKILIFFKNILSFLRKSPASLHKCVAILVKKKSLEKSFASLWSCQILMTVMSFGRKKLISGRIKF